MNNYYQPQQNSTPTFTVHT